MKNSEHLKKQAWKLGLLCMGLFLASISLFSIEVDFKYQFSTSISLLLLAMITGFKFGTTITSYRHARSDASPPQEVE